MHCHAGKTPRSHAEWQGYVHGAYRWSPLCHLWRQPILIVIDLINDIRWILGMIAQKVVRHQRDQLP